MGSVATAAPCLPRVAARYHGDRRLAITTRALETYWSGFAAWFLDHTDRASWRHREATERIRTLVLCIGERLVAVRHGVPAPELNVQLDQLAWQIDVLARRRGLERPVQQRTHEALTCVRTLLPEQRGLPRGMPSQASMTPTT